MAHSDTTEISPSSVRLADSLVMVAAEANRNERAVAVMFSIFAYELLTGEIDELSGYNVETIQQMFSTITKEQTQITAPGLALRESFLSTEVQVDGWQKELQDALEVYEDAERRRTER